MCSRIDFFSEDRHDDYGVELKNQIEERLKFLANGQKPRKNIDVMKQVYEKLKNKEMGIETEDIVNEDENNLLKKKKKKAKKVLQEAEAIDDDEIVEKPKKKKKKAEMVIKEEEQVEEEEIVEKPKKKNKTK